MSADYFLFPDGCPVIVLLLEMLFLCFKHFVPLHFKITENNTVRSSSQIMHLPSLFKQKYNLCIVCTWGWEWENKYCVTVFYFFIIFVPLVKYIKEDLHTGSLFKIECVKMIILCIVMTNPGASITDAFYKVFPVVLQSEGYNRSCELQI